MRLWALLILVVALVANAVDDDITCHQSGMCSVGKVKHFYGTVATSEGFLTAMESVSYKREVVLVTTFGSYYLEFVFQLHSQFKKLGIGHFLTLSMKEEGCEEVASVGRGNKQISCGWDDSLQHPRSWGGGPLLWHLRWKFLARSARAAYNVLSLDSDYMVLQDPYVFLKRPPLNRAKLLATNEHGCGMNGGFAYIQNTSADGPVAWLFHHTTEVALRWMDEDMKTIEAFGKMEAGKSQMCMTFDQSFLDDSLHSTMVGKPITKMALAACLPDDWSGEGGLSKTSAIDTQTSMVKCDEIKSEVVQPPVSFPKEPRFPDFFNHFNSMTIKTPAGSAGSMPPELGGPIYSTKGGQYTEQYFELLKGDCADDSQCPWWKSDSDPEHANDVTEEFGFVPSWLSTSAAALNHGWLTPVDGSRPRQVMFHFHVLPFVRNEWKAAVSKIYGAFDWKLSKFLHANKESHAKLAPGPYLAGHIPTKVLLLSPSIDMSKTRSLREFKQITAGLVQLALLSGRTVVYPDMPCATPWVHQDVQEGPKACNNSLGVLRLIAESMPYSARTIPHDRDVLTKEWRVCSAFLADNGCLGPNKNMSGMLNVEYEEWVRNDCPSHNANGPWHGNTFLHKEPKLSAGRDGGFVADEIVVLNELEAKHYMRQFDNEFLVYLGSPVVVNMSEANAEDAKEGDWKKKFWDVLQDCRGLYYTPYMIDSQGAAKVTEYVKGPLASIVDGKIVLDGGASALNLSSRLAEEALNYELKAPQKSPSQSGGGEEKKDQGEELLYKGNVSVPVLSESTEGLQCEESGMCSLGKVKRYEGEVTSGKGMKDMFDTVSYKKELIVVTTYGVLYVEFVFQLYSQVRRLGMNHMLALTMNSTGCEQLATADRGYLNMSCGWDDSPQHERSWGGGPRLWHLRWKFMARSARMGYNILALDSDYMIFQDPYVFLKSPPLDSYNLMGVEEHGCGMNGGFAYIQNTKPDGPVAWLFHHTTEVPLRWMDDNMTHIVGLGKMRPKDNMCMTFDQSFLDDALHSCMSGVPITALALFSCTLPGWKYNEPEGPTREEAFEKQRGFVSCVSRFKSHQMQSPKEWPAAPKLPGPLMSYRSSILQVPNPKGNPDPAEFGGPMWTREGGNYTGHYFQQLKEDCPDCPWWKDEKEDDAKEAESTTEQFTFLPKWFSASAAGLNHGYLTPLDGSRPRQVMMHFHVLMLAAREWKGAVAKIFGAFDWELSRFLHSDTEANKKMMPGPYFCGAPPLRVIALHPDIDLSKTANLQEFNRIVAGLVQVAFMTDRSIVYPDIPCKAKWVHSGGDISACTDTSKTLSIGSQQYLPRAARVAPYDTNDKRKEFRIAHAYLANRDCLGPNNDKFQAMLEVEFEQWCAVDAPAGTTLIPGPTNTLFDPSGGANGDPSKVVVLNSLELEEELKNFEKEPLMYMGRAFVTDMTDFRVNSEPRATWRYKFWYLLQKCHGLYWEPEVLDKSANLNGVATVGQYVSAPLASISKGQVLDDGGRQALSKVFASMGCSKTGLCSRGWSEVYVGEVGTAEGLKAALNATAFKKEIILAPSAGQFYVQYALAAQDRFLDMGMSHIIAVSNQEKWCKSLKEQAEGSTNARVMSCGWDDSPMGDVEGISAGNKMEMGKAEEYVNPLMLWLLRWKLLARITRMGYNVMALDLDTVPLLDPYPILKSEPLKELNLLVSTREREGGDAKADDMVTLISTNFLYTQNVKPDGATAYLFHRATQSALRLLGGSKTPSMQKGWNGTACKNLDMLLLVDAMSEVLSGSSIDSSKGWLAGCTGQADMPKSSIVEFQDQVLQFPIPEGDSGPKLPDALTALKTKKLAMPGKLASFEERNDTPVGVYLALLKADCADCPDWKAGAADTSEELGVVPKWLMGSISEVNHGLIRPSSGTKPRQIFLHISNPNFSSFEWKVAVSKVVEAHNWAMDKLQRDNKEIAKNMIPGPYISGKAPVKVLVLSTRILLNETKGWEDFMRITLGVMQLAFMSDRTPVIPDIPCNAKWMNQGGLACNGLEPLSLPPHLIPYGGLKHPTSADQQDREMRIANAYLLLQKCMGWENGPFKVISQTEYEEWVGSDAPKHTANGPWEGNTIFKTKQEYEKTDHFYDPVMLDEKEAGNVIGKKGNELLLYLGRPVFVNMGGEDIDAFNGWRKKFNAVVKICPALHSDPSKPPVRGEFDLAAFLTAPKATLNKDDEIDEDSLPSS